MPEFFLAIIILASFIGIMATITLGMRKEANDGNQYYVNCSHDPKDWNPSERAKRGIYTKKEYAEALNSYLKGVKTS